MNGQKRKKLSAAEWIEILLFAFGWFGLDLFLQHRVQNLIPAAYSGTDGLRQIRHYLIMWLVTRYLRILLPGVLLLLTGAAVQICSRKSPKPSGLRLLAAGFAVIICMIVSLRFKNRFDLQCERNGYRGTAAMQAAELLSDIGKDLEAEADAPQMYLPVPHSEAYFYHVPGGRSHRPKTVTVYEYALRDENTDEIIAQISYEEYKRAKDESLINNPRAVSCYPNSGLIASVDGTDGTAALRNCEAMFTLTYSEADQTIHRTEYSDADILHRLTLVLARGGEHIAEIGMEHETTVSFHSGMNTTAWLQVRHNGKTVRVSNEITF